MSDTPRTDALVAWFPGCPCLYTTPCAPSCSCAQPFSSRGCDRCASYGNLDQRKRAAERLAAVEAYAEETRRSLGWALDLVTDWVTMDNFDMADYEKAKALVGKNPNEHGALAQSGRAPACHAEGQGIEAPTPRHPSFDGAMVERGGGWVKVQRLSDEDADALVAIVQGCHAVGTLQPDPEVVSAEAVTDELRVLGKLADTLYREGSDHRNVVLGVIDRLNLLTQPEASDFSARLADWRAKNPAVASRCENCGARAWARSQGKVCCYSPDVSAQVKVPDGWKLMPVTPTLDMLHVGHKAKERYGAVEHVWDAMVEAAPQTILSQGHAEPHPDTLLLDFLEAAWPSMELDVHDHGDASLGLSFDDGRREGSMRADSLRDLLNHLRAHINNPENAQEPKP